MDVLWIDLIKEFLTEAAKADLSQKILVFIVAWAVVRKSIKGHLERIEKGLGDETSHAQRITNLENGFQVLNNKVSDLEKKKGE